jgi:hypothetical protein
VLVEQLRYRPHMTECYYLGIFSSRYLRDAGLMADAPQWDGKVYKRAKFGDISIKGTAKEHEMKL